jgi:DNA repair exonuclease SbcCD nuclease subunit
LKYYKKYIADKGVKFFGLSGNHDFSERNGLDHRSPTHLRKLTVFEGFSLLDDFDTAITKDGLVIQGIPYMDNDADTVKEIKNRSNELGMHRDRTKILLLHQDFPGAKTPAGFECKEYNALNLNLNKLFKPWDFVLCGHIHKPQQLAKNAWMLGSPIHQISSDEGTNMGYWIIYRNRKPRFIGLNDLFPVFITIKHDEQVEDTHDYYIRLPKDDLVEKKVKKHKFNVNNDRSQLALSYSKVKGIKNKSKIKALKKILSEV